MKYYLFLLIASIWLFTVLCVNGATVTAQGGPPVTDADSLNGNVETLLEAFSQIETTSNPFVKSFHDKTKKGIDSFEEDKTFIQNAVNEGTEMEKKIQSISVSLKSSTVTLPAELQSELEEIEKNAAAELKKLKGVEDVKDIEEMHKRYKEKYAEIKGKIEELSTLSLDEIKKEAAGKSKTKVTEASVAQAQTQEESNPFVEKVKTKLIEFIKTSVQDFFTVNKDTDTIRKKMDVASSALSNIRSDLIKVEQMEYHLLGAHKDLFKTDVAFLTRSSMMPFAFAIMFGMLF